MNEWGERFISAWGQGFISTLHEAAIRAGNGDKFINDLRRCVEDGTLSGEWATYLRRARIAQKQEAKQ